MPVIQMASLSSTTEKEGTMTKNKGNEVSGINRRNFMAKTAVVRVGLAASSLSWAASQHHPCV